ncbi:MAG: NUDIX hydrolase [Pseudomonadota bacterium]
MIRILRSSICILSSLGIGSCAHLPQGCSPSGMPNYADSAACFSVEDGKLLVVQSWSGKISLPGGLSHRGEAAQCTALRETWEETGLLLQPTRRLPMSEGSFILYECERGAQTPTPGPRFSLENRRAMYISPNDFDRYEWRFANKLKRLRQLVADTDATSASS